MEFLRRRERRLLVVVARHLTRRRPEHRSAAPGPPRSPPSSRSSRVALPGAATTLPPRRLFSGAAASPDASEAPTHRCSSRSADAQMLLSQTTQERPEARLHRGLRARDDLALETDVGTTKHRRPAHEEHEEHEEEGAASSRRTNDRARGAHRGPRLRAAQPGLGDLRPRLSHARPHARSRGGRRHALRDVVKARSYAAFP